MSGSIESLRASVRVTDGACNDHDFICRCKPVDVRFALAKIERLQRVVDYLDNPRVLLEIPQPHRMKLSEMLHGSEAKDE